MPIGYHTGAFPPTTIDWQALIPLIGPTSAAIARYDGVLAAVPDTAILLSPLMSRNSVFALTSLLNVAEGQEVSR
jgi:hypothetical protein